MLLIVLLASVALSIAIARTILAWTFHLMNAGLPCAFHWKPVAFAAAVFWFWYLAPVIAESRAATTVIRLVAIHAVHDQGYRQVFGSEPSR